MLTIFKDIFGDLECTYCSQKIFYTDEELLENNNIIRCLNCGLQYKVYREEDEKKGV